MGASHALPRDINACQPLRLGLRGICTPRRPLQGLTGGPQLALESGDPACASGSVLPRAPERRHHVNMPPA